MWTSVQRARCLLNLVGTPGEDKSQQIDDCKHANISTTEYDLIYWPAPLRRAETRIDPYACTDEYMLRYYAFQFDRSAPIARCSWCKDVQPTSPPTALPTPLPTSFPTPPPTAAPTPMPTRGRGEGCKLTMFKEEHFKGQHETLKFDLKKCVKGHICSGTDYIGGFMNNHVKSWKASGSQCKFCFYGVAEYHHFLGARRATAVRRSSKRFRKVSSVIILDTRYDTNCPRMRDSYDSTLGNTDDKSGDGQDEEVAEEGAEEQSDWESVQDAPADQSYALLQKKKKHL